jgi:hypothetical protein
MYQESDYEKFAAKMEEKYPSMFEGSYGGFAIGPGWWPIVESLCAHIQSHVVQSNERRKLLLESNPYNTPIPDEVPPVVVEQIKEKFGGLRFYHTGGNSRIDGMVTMAEAWAAHAKNAVSLVKAKPVGGLKHYVMNMRQNAKNE